MNNKHSEKKGGGFPLLELALGAALATGAGYMYVTHKEEIDKEAKKRIDHLAKKFHQSKAEIEKRVKKVWGDASKNAIASYLDLRGALLHELADSNLAQKGAMLKKHYEAMVDTVIKTARKSGMLNGETEKKLAEVFKMDWKDVEKMLMKAVMKGAQKTVGMVQKMKTAKKARVVKKTVMKAAKKMAKKTVAKPAKKSAKKKR